MDDLASASSLSHRNRERKTKTIKEDHPFWPQPEKMSQSTKKSLQQETSLPGFKKLLDENPCVAEHEASLHCITNRSKSACKRFFEDYKECMKKWRREQREAKLSRM
ncbi:hypothetical protein BWQ96_07956 [Gracilariopsis chorda]|uniref:Cytochrome c oxidase-assembly factor COX23, mitochondrial n=1 Tax=Gracilariopsis chorda TaxID=448386 RepID=A0A2V3IJS7_9FLOR|nr:hypothetical protein BWQ96_07956 [Gracilariopsis chorda]|eukprot:PXF42321.1 hypothetical protein BWQ96_07956 [Gracilariopsis chorda]